MKLVGSGTAGVVLCCADAGGDMFAVKKIISDSDHAFQRSLREVAPLPRRTTAQRSCSRPQRSWLTDHRAGSAHVPAASSQHRECRRRVLFDRHRAVCERVLCGPSAGRFRSHAVLPRRSRVAHPLQPASADERAYSGAPARWRRRSFSAHSRTSLLRRSTFWSKCCVACGEGRSRCASLARARLTCVAGTCTLAASSIAT